MENIKKDISIVVPLLNEELNIMTLYNELKNVLKDMLLSYEIIFIDDGSSDSSFNIIKDIKHFDENVSGISLSRNYGHQVALMAGMEAAIGDVVITMDADMQHPPELIRELYEKHKEGFDIVNTRRIDTEGTGVMKKITSKFFYSLINKISDFKIEPASADFRLMNRIAVNALLSLKEKDRFTRGLVSWIGYRQTLIDYYAPERMAGQTKYTLRKMIRFAVDGITSFSSKPLRISFYLGLIIFIVGIIYSVYAIVEHIKGHTVPGWTSLLISIFIIGSIQLLSIGILGEYIARVFNESKDRPLYFVKEKI